MTNHIQRTFLSVSFLLCLSQTPLAHADDRDDAIKKLREETQQLRVELEELRGEIKKLKAAASGAPTASSIAPGAQSPDDEARQLCVAAIQGDSGALDKLADLAAGLRTMEPDEQAATRSRIRSAFKLLGTEAGNGNTAGLQALWRASRNRNLQGFAVEGLGQAAGLGNEEALKALLDPEKHLILPSSATSALKPAADAGNERAIQALAATAADPKQQGLWGLAVKGLEAAAAAGNATAIDALATVAAGQNKYLSKEAVFALEAAALKNQPRAEEALRKLGLR